ncbi:dipeptide ABC transporter ATP-binding protein [Pseudomonas sp. KNUC1026]|uniref:dipeptide ABC transporter ATP-binding protein n=1 Tax=Pseudomonas sp. KNUC1026 TaxID=2893890 RepID=UPI001F3E773C|nr:ABC transporter ATP-binding protein [Pseudomonas sp. KNUC1026]UFH51073.1 ABC transporter ATP-binding protein [Pseudomonas sp. KNUC1026]
MSLLDVRGLRVAYQGVAAVHGLGFQLEAGETLALVGESGCGKSTTAQALMGLLPSNAQVSGLALFEGRDLLAMPARERRQLQGNALGMVFQEPLSSLNPVLTLGEQVSEVLLAHSRLTRRQAWQRAEELLALVQLPRPRQHLHEYPHHLSGGQRQRVVIAMAIACEPRLLIADEPTTALDVSVQAQILKLLDRLRRELGMGVLLITHDLGVVAEQADRVLVMHDGHSLEHAGTRTLLNAPRHPYTQGLLKASLGAAHQEHYLKARLPEIRVTRQSGQPNQYAISDTRHNVAPQAPATTGGLLEVRDLNLSYGERPVLNALDLTLGPRESLGLVGESGCGKSTLSKALLGLLEPSSGRIEYAGQNIATLSAAERLPWRRQVQMIFQDPAAALNPRHSIDTLLDRVQRLHGQADARERLRERLRMLDAVGLPAASLQRLPHQFSGGQRQRIGIARALILKPKLVICDEPVSALDVSTQAQILNLLVELREAFGLSYLFISHDLSVVRWFCDRVLVMHGGRIVEQATPDALWQQPQHPYTRRLLAAIPGHATQPYTPQPGLQFAVGW